MTGHDDNSAETLKLPTLFWCLHKRTARAPPHLQILFVVAASTEQCQGTQINGYGAGHDMDI